MSPDAQPLSKVTRSSTAKPGDEVLVLRSGAADPKDRVVLVPADKVAAASGVTVAAILNVLQAGPGVTVTLQGSKIVISSTVQAAAAPGQPDAPTAGVVNDIGDTFSFLPTAAYPSFAQYKVAGLPGVSGAVVLDGTNSYVQNGRIYVRVVGAVAAGGLAVYVAGSGNIPDGKPLLSNAAFTGTTAPTGDTTAPVISITVPTSGAVLVPGTAVTLTAQATDNVAVTGVTFTNGGTGAVLGAGVKNGNTYTYSYTPTAAGPLTITATAVDAAGNSQTASVSVTVQATANQAPSVALSGGSSGTVGTAISYQAIASDSDGTVQLVELLVDGTSVSSDSDSPYVLSWTPTAAGTFKVKAKVTDDKGATSFSSEITVVVQAAVATPTAYPLTDGMFWDNGQNIAKSGYTVRSPYSYTRFALPAGVNSFEVQVVDTLPTANPATDLLRSVGIRVGGVYQQTVSTVGNAGTATWYPVTVTAGSTVDVENGFLEKVPGQDYTGIFITAIRLVGTPTFLYPGVPQRRVVGYGDSIMTGAVSPEPSKYAALNLARAELPSAWRVSFESYSARALADDYAEALGTSGRAAFISKLSAMLDGTLENVLLSEIGTNDNPTDVNTFSSRYGALIDALHTARPDVRVILQAPTVRTDVNGPYIAAIQQAVLDLKSIRPWLQAYNPTSITQADLFTDNLHLTQGGQRKAADLMIDAILHPPAQTGSQTLILNPLQRTLTPSASWFTDPSPGFYASANGEYSVDPTAQDSYTTELVGFDIIAPRTPNGSTAACRYRIVNSGAAFQEIQGTQIASPAQYAATIFSIRGLPYARYEVYVSWNGQGSFSGLLADQWVVYRS